MSEIGTLSLDGHLVQLWNANPGGDIFQTRVYGFDGLQTRVPGFDYVSSIQFSSVRIFL